MFRQFSAISISSRHVKEADPVELAANVDVLCLCLRGDADLHDVLADSSLLKALGKGLIVVNHTSGDPTGAENFERMAKEFGVGFLDAPVSGGRPGAEARSLTCFVGGRTEALDRTRPVIECHSIHIVSMGAAGSGQMAKLCNNALTVSNLRSVVEVFEMAEKLGVSLAGLRDAFARSSGGSFILQGPGCQGDREQRSSHRRAEPGGRRGVRGSDEPEGRRSHGGPEMGDQRPGRTGGARSTSAVVV